MKKKMKLMLLVVAMAVIVGASMNPVSAATLTLDEAVLISFDKAEFNISVYPGNASYSGTDMAGNVVTGVFGDGTVLGYRFVNSNELETVISSYADDGTGIVAPVVSPPDVTDIDGNESWANVWTTTDPGVDFANAADITTDTIARARNITGTIDISRLSSGTVYVICGGIKETVTLTVTMSGAGQTDIQAVYSIDLPGGSGPLAKNYFWVVPFDFSDAGGYDTITYHYTTTLNRRSRFVGVIIDSLGVGIISPTDGDTVNISDSLPLIWTNMDPVDGNDVYVDVWFGTEPNDLHPVPDFDLVVEKGLNTESVFVNANAVDTYYWQVNSWVNGADKIDDANMIIGTVWSFTATSDPAPTVEIHTPAMMTWSGEPVPLDATITNEGLSPTIIKWSADVPDGIDVEFDPASADTEDTTVTLTKVSYFVPFVANSSFEDPALDNDTWIYIEDGVASWSTMWSVPGSDTWSPVASQGGAYDPDDGDFTVGIPDGENVAWLETDYVSDHCLYQQILDTIEPSTTYQLSVKVGNPSLYNLGATADYRIEIVGAGVAAVDGGPSPVDNTSWLSASCTYVSGADDVADPNVGQPLAIRLIGEAYGTELDDGYEVDFDEVVLQVDGELERMVYDPEMSTVTVKVAVSDAANPTPVEESIEIDVYQDACEMAKNGLNTPVAATDFNVDCITNLPDFAEFASAWLDDSAATEAVERP